MLPLQTDGMQTGGMLSGRCEEARANDTDRHLRGLGPLGLDEDIARKLREAERVRGHVARLSRARRHRAATELSGLFARARVGKQGHPTCRVARPASGRVRGEGEESRLERAIWGNQRPKSVT